MSIKQSCFLLRMINLEFCSFLEDLSKKNCMIELFLQEQK